MNCELQQCYYNLFDVRTSLNGYYKLINKGNVVAFMNSSLYSLLMNCGLMLLQFDIMMKDFKCCNN